MGADVRSADMPAAGPSGCPYIPVPAMKVDAPACNAAAMASCFIPPSTAISMGSPLARLSSHMPLTSWILGSWLCRKDCPPKPGSTVMISTRSILSQTCSSAIGGVFGRTATAGAAPASKMASMTGSVSVVASMCIVMMSAPACAVWCMRFMGDRTIIWASMGSAVSLRRASNTGGPKLRLGTKFPSMMSK